MARHGFWKRLLVGVGLAAVALGGTGCTTSEHNGCCKPPKFDPCCLNDLPVFLTPLEYVSLPLEETYLAAFDSLPDFWRDELNR